MLAIAATVNAYKILVLVPTTEENNWNYMQIFIDKLMNRGHEITCITSQTATHLFQVHRNYTEILIDPPFKVDSGSVRKYIMSLYWVCFSFLFIRKIFIYYGRKYLYL